MKLDRANYLTGIIPYMYIGLFGIKLATTFSQEMLTEIVTQCDICGGYSL